MPVTDYTRPTDLVFKQDGSYGIFFDCDWDDEHGVVVIIKPKIQAGPQDISL